MNDPILTEARSLYADSVIDTKDVRSHIWAHESHNHDLLTAIIENVDAADHVEDLLAKTDMYAINIPDEITKVFMMDWQAKYLAKQGFEGSIPSTPNLCRMLATCYHIEKHMKLQDATVIELGGGNGQFAAMAKTFGMKQHIDIDIPESLFMAYVCTRVRFPQAKCQWITSDMDGPQPDAEFIFCPVQHASCFENCNFDLFVNTASMGELPNSQIRFWMDFVQNGIKVKYFYGLNRFLNTIELKNPSDYSVQRANENLASVLFDANWKVLLWEVEPLMCRCPYQDPRIARYLELMLERLDKSDDDPGAMGEMGVQDWWRYRDVNPLGTQRSNQLMHDLTLGGTLYHLWNALRIIPSKGAVDMMLTYLQWIGRDNTMFEEELHYQELRQTL